MLVFSVLSLSWHTSRRSVSRRIEPTLAKRMAGKVAEETREEPRNCGRDDYAVDKQERSSVPGDDYCCGAATALSQRKDICSTSNLVRKGIRLNESTSTRDQGPCSRDLRF